MDLYSNFGTVMSLKYHLEQLTIFLQNRIYFPKSLFCSKPEDMLTCDATKMDNSYVYNKFSCPPPFIYRWYFVLEILLPSKPVTHVFNKTFFNQEHSTSHLGFTNANRN